MTTIKIRSKFCYEWSIIFLLIYDFYCVILQHLFGNIITYLLFVISVFLILLGKYLEDGFTFCISNLYAYLPLIYIFLVSIFYDCSIQKKEFYAPGRIIVCLLMLFILADSTKWVKKIPKIITVLGMPNAIATVFFWLIPSAYKPFASRFIGTTTVAEGMGYTYGLTDFYSENAIYISFTILALWSICLIEKKNWFIRICLLINVFALLLTTKRAHLIFVIVAMIFTFFMENPEKVSRKVIEGILLGGASLLFIYWISRYIPALQKTIERLMLMGTSEDSTSKTRFVFWHYAIEWFREKPIFGNGLFYFKYRFKPLDEYNRFINAHNVYIQLLCETGIVGAVTYVLGVTAIFIKTIKITVLKYIKSLKTEILLSLGFQIFVLLYQMTGNGFYDRVLAFQILALAIPAAVTKTISQ